MPEPATAAHDGTTLARLRRAKDWTVYRLAQAAKLPQSTIGRIEAEGGMTLRVARALCQALGCSLAVFDQKEGKP